MTISVVIPTWNRIDYLQRAINGLLAQERPPEEIVLGVREEDVTTRDFVGEHYAHEPRVRVALVHEPGVVASMQAAVDRTTGDIVCLLDDDAEPLPDWLERIHSYLTTDEKLGAIGGRDWLMYLSDEERDQNLVDRVGVIQWYGKPVGNHHCGRGGFRPVDILKGCNCAFRGPLIRHLGFDRILRGADTQTHWETALCLDVANAGYGIGYDANLIVKHYVAPRHGPDQNFRGGFSPEGIEQQAHNEAYVHATRLPWSRRLPCQAYTLLVGSRNQPGLLQALRLILRREPHVGERCRRAWRGYFDGLKTARAWRRQSPT